MSDSSREQIYILEAKKPFDYFSSRTCICRVCSTGVGAFLIQPGGLGRAADVSNAAVEGGHTGLAAPASPGRQKGLLGFLRIYQGFPGFLRVSEHLVK